MRKKILIVEDDTDLLEMLRLSFKSAGFSIATATNGIEALKKVRSLLPDLIVLDLVLPELDGFAVCEILRKDRATATIPIIMLTGLSSEFTRFAGLESGATDYVTKPVTPSELVSKAHYWLRPPAGPTRAEPSARGKASSASARAG
jgi:two-component system, OmpR family, alkaline phosphatase synthesis response regulator PhoP